MPLSLIFLLGWAVLSAQVIFLRELSIVFYGNELSFSVILANWLLGGGLGGIGGACLASRLKQLRPKIAFLFAALGTLLPVILAGMRLSRGFLGIPQGEVMGISQIYLLSSAFLVLPAFFFSLTFTLAVEEMRRRSPSPKTATRGYMAEALGSGLGGLVLSFLFLTECSGSQILAGVSGLLFAASLFLFSYRRLSLLLGIPVVAACVAGGNLLESRLLAAEWKGYEVLESANTPYGRLLAARRKDQVSFFGNGFLLASVPDHEASEALVHPPLALHPAPRRVLLAGESSPACLREILKYPVEEIVSVELDPRTLLLKRKYTRPLSREEESRVRFIAGDGRRFLKKTRDIFDVIIVALPEPSTLLINRFYTAEFFREAARHLAPQGVLALRLPGMANYPSRELVVLIESIRKTLARIFPRVEVLPMKSTHLLASSETQSPPSDAGHFLARLRERKIKNLFFNENYVPFLWTGERTSLLNERLSRAHSVLDNRDLRPTAQFYATLYWSAYVSPRLKSWLHALSGLPQGIWFLVPPFWFLTVLALKKTRAFKPVTLLGAMGWTGFSEIGFQMVIVLAYQAIYGYAYLWVAVILASFMMGLVLGSALTLGLASAERGLAAELKRVQFGIIFYPLVLALVLLLCERGGFSFHPAFEFFFPFLAVVAGFFGGWQFPLVQRILSLDRHAGRVTGLVYGVDLMGSCAGALAIGSFLVPVLGGVKVCLWLAMINFASWLLLRMTKL